MAETENTCCPCRYLGREAERGYEPDPSKWSVVGRKSNEQIWIEYLHVRHAGSGKPSRARVQANHFSERRSCAAANPLTLKAARSLRFSMSFMEEFARNNKQSLTFRGVVYENSERPEICKALPADVDIRPCAWRLPRDHPLAFTSPRPSESQSGG